MNYTKVKELKKKLVYVPLKVELETGEIVYGHLAPAKFEKRILKESGLLELSAMLQKEYFCLVNPDTQKASFLLASDIERVSLVR